MFSISIEAMSTQSLILNLSLIHQLSPTWSIFDGFGWFKLFFHSHFKIRGFLMSKSNPGDNYSNPCLIRDHYSLFCFLFYWSVTVDASWYPSRRDAWQTPRYSVSHPLLAGDPLHQCQLCHPEIMISDKTLTSHDFIKNLRLPQSSRVLVKQWSSGLFRVQNQEKSTRFH